MKVFSRHQVFVLATPGWERLGKGAVLVVSMNNLNLCFSMCSNDGVLKRHDISSGRLVGTDTVVKVDGHLLSGWYNRHSYLQLNKKKFNDILRVLGVSKLSPETFMTVEPDGHPWGDASHLCCCPDKHA